jgi:hypothetical protein
VKKSAVYATMKRVEGAETLTGGKIIEKPLDKKII